MATRRFYSPRLSRKCNYPILQLAFRFLLIISCIALPYFIGQAHAAQVTLAWDRNAESNVAGYKIYYGNASRDYDWWIDVGDVTSFTLTNLGDGATYYFAATAYDNANPPLESTYSDEVSKSTCSYSITPTSNSFGASGGSGSVSVTTQAGCPWDASSGAPWMTITSGSSGTGSGTVNYSIGSNTTANTRTAISTIAGKVFTVNQAAASSYTITASSGTGGTISPSGSVSVAQGGSQTFNITANTGYTISSVTVDGVSQGALSSYTFTNVTANHTISATFTANTYTISASAGAGGSISPSGAVSVSHGANRSFTITANTGYQVSSVTVDGTSVGAVTSYTFSNVTANHTISATFSIRTYTITASAGTGGSISPSGSVSVSHGSNQSFTITANTGYQVSSVTVDGTSVGAVNSYTFSNVTAGHTISATFSAITYTITASAGTGGSISPTGAVSVNHGANRTFTITANTGYTIANVLVDGASVGAVSSYTFTNVTTGHTISASFNITTYTISASAGTGGSISPSGSVSINHGANRTFTITPDTGYGVSSVLVDGASVGAVSSYTFSNVTANHTISASFAVNTHTINASAGTGGTISPSGAVPVSGGANQTFTITPNTGYRIANVLVDGSSVGTVGSFTFTNVSSSHTISASFAANTYTINASAGVGGSISPNGAVTVNHGVNQTFTITANTGYTVAGVTVDGVSRGAISSYTFSNVTANHTISATFTVNNYTINATAGAGGTISPNGSVSVNHGANQTFTITPAGGYSISNILVDGVSQGAVNSYTFSNVTANHAISASFNQITYTIQASATPGGSISPSGTVTVAQGANQTFTITPDSGYVISDVLVDGSSVGAGGSYTFTNIGSNRTITANFVQGYTLTITTTGTGSGDVTSDPQTTVYSPGTKVTLKATKDESSSFEGFSGDCTTKRSSCTLTMNKHANVSATFKLKTLKFKTTVIGNGTIALEEPITVEGGIKGQREEKKGKKVVKVKKAKHNTEIEYGDQLVYRIIPEPGNYIKNVAIDGKSQGSVESLTFADIKRNHNVKVKFETETESNLTKKIQLVKHQVFLQDKEGTDELQNPNDLSDDVDDDDPVEPPSTSYASVNK
jgi:hypothetical protein